MTDIVERLRVLAEYNRNNGIGSGHIIDLAADEIERLRADLLKAEMRAEIAGLENIMRAVARGRREGIEAAIEAAMRVPIPEDASVAEAHGRLAAAQDICARIGALLEDER